MKLRLISIIAILLPILLVAGCKISTSSAQPSASNSTNQVDQDADFQADVNEYRNYVIQESDSLVTDTKKFTDAVKSGDFATAKTLYATTRMHYERIEPIAEAFGDLDPDIDARDGDVDAAQWRGFHRIEQALWTNPTPITQDQLNTYADQLLSDVKLLRAKVETVDIDANMLVSGSVDLLNEVATSKVTGEEDRYSRTDLYDFEANIEGAQKIFEVLQPQIAKKDAALAQQLENLFNDTFDALKPYKQGNNYVLYDTLTAEQTKVLAQKVNALAAPLSQVGIVLGLK